MSSVRRSKAGPDAPQHAVGCFVLVLVALIPDSASAELWESRFFDECLTLGATRFTAEFNAYHADSYVVNKLQLVEALPRAARERGLKLRGLLIVGPQGPMWSYHIFTFLEEEGGWVRVNALVMPHARITGKSTAFLSLRQFTLLSEHLRELSFVRAARDTSALRAELSPKQTSKQAELDPEWEFEFVFAELEPQQPSLLFGSLNGHAGSERRQLSAVLRPLTDGLVPTYQLGRRHPAAIQKTHWRVAVWPLIGFQHDPLPELNRELTELGYAELDAAEHWLGVGVDVSWRGLRFGSDLAVALPRLTPHATGADAQASFGRRRVAVRVGYDVLAGPEFRVFPLLGLRSGVTTLSGGSERTGSLELAQSFESLEVAIGFDGHIPLSRWLYKPWLVVGARVGHVLASWHDNWETAERDGFGEMPGAPESSFFGMFVFGLGFEPP